MESQLQDVLPEHINAEIASGTIRSREDAVDYLTWTFFFRRLVRNPTYYNLEDTSPEGVTAHLKSLVDGVLLQLSREGCITLGDGTDENEEERELIGHLGSKKSDRVSPTLGLIASYYYISSKSVGLFDRSVDDVKNVPDLLRLLSDAFEYVLFERVVFTRISHFIIHLLITLMSSSEVSLAHGTSLKILALRARTQTQIRGTSSET